MMEIGMLMGMVMVERTMMVSMVRVTGDDVQMRNHKSASLLYAITQWTTEVQALPPSACEEKDTLLRVAGVLSVLLVITSIIIAIQFKRRKHKQEDSPNIPNQQIRPFIPDVTFELLEHKQQHPASGIRISQNNGENIYEEIPPDNRNPMQGYSGPSDLELEAYIFLKDSTVFYSTVNDIYEPLESLETISDISQHQ